ncbi:helix-turn-helix domain-containing protein [bacterium]|nr:helix-turn-helix domain-containing protein [bacterium]
MNERLRELREAFGFTQSEMAERIGMKQSNYSLIESGATKIPQILFVALAELGVNINWLMTGIGTRLVMPEEMREEIKKDVDTEPVEVFTVDKEKAEKIQRQPENIQYADTAAERRSMRRATARSKCRPLVELCDAMIARQASIEARIDMLEHRLDELEEVR